MRTYKTKLEKLIPHYREAGLVTRAYVLLVTDVGCEQEVCKIIKTIPEVRDAYTLHGVYDLLIDIETDDLNYLKEVIQKRIRSMEKVRSTLTMIERVNKAELGKP